MTDPRESRVPMAGEVWRSRRYPETRVRVARLEGPLRGGLQRHVVVQVVAASGFEHGGTMAWFLRTFEPVPSEEDRAVSEKVAAGLLHRLGHWFSFGDWKVVSASPFVIWCAREHPEYWNVRGIGNDYNLPCLVTGEPQELCSNISGFVASRAAGERVVALFGGRARLDYREHEPSWIQVKVGVSVGYEAVLERLFEGVLALEGMIDKRVIAWAVNPDKSPGYKPRILERAAKAEQERDEANKLYFSEVAIASELAAALQAILDSPSSFEDERLKYREAQILKVEEEDARAALSKYQQSQGRKS